METVSIDENWDTNRYSFIIVMVLGAMVVLIGISMSASAATLPSWIGSDMIVTGDEYYNDCSSELGADIVVQNGGNLTLDNVSLNISAGFGIEVQNGGRLYIVDSTLQFNATTGTPWWIHLNIGGILIIDNSTLDGYGDFSLYGVQATITDNILTPESSSINGIDMWYNSNTYSNDGPVITGNTITQSYNGLYLDGGWSNIMNASLNDNTITSNWEGMYLDLNYATTGDLIISGNDLVNVNDDGIYIYARYADIDGLEINDNIITNSNTYYAIYLNIEYGQFSGSFDASGNDIQNVDYGMYFYDRYSTWDQITINDNNVNSLNRYFIYFYPYRTTYNGDITLNGNTFANQNGWYDTIRWYFSSSSLYAPTFNGDFTFNDNSFTNTRTAMYFYNRYSTFSGTLTHMNNTYSSISGYGFYFYIYYGGADNISIKDNTWTSISSYGFYYYQSSYQSMGNVEVVNNSLSTVSSYGIYVYGYGADWGNITVHDNDLDNVNSYNIYLYFYRGSAKDINVYQNNIDNNGGYGIFLYGYYASSIGYVNIHNNTAINARSYAIYFYCYRTTSIKDVTAVDNQLSSSGGWGYGLYLSMGYVPAPNITVERNVVQNFGGYGLYVNFYRANPSTVRINNNTVVGCNDGIYINNGYGTVTRFFVQNNTIVSNNWNGIYLSLYGSTSSPVVTNNQVVNNGNGIYLTGYSGANLMGGVLSNNTMIKNNVGLVLDENLDMRIEYNKIQSNNQRGLQVWGTWSGTNIEGAIYNNIITNNQVDINVEDGVTLKSYNNTFETATATTWNMKPQLLVMGILDVRVLWEDGSGPVADAELTIVDSQGNQLLDDRTDGGGNYKDIEIIIYTVDPDGTVYNSPVRINASKFGIASSTLVDLESETSVTILLDNVPPTVEISTPKEMLITNVYQLKVAGQTEIGAIVEINNVPVNLTAAGTFEYFIDLDKEGNNDIRIEAQDRFNNTATIIIHVVRDTVSPILEVHSPKDGESTNSPSLLVEGETEPGAIAKINEQIVPVDDIGRFSGTVLLTEGENTITTTVSDKAGNEVTMIRIVYLDSVPPSINILTPESGLITNLKEIELRGIASGASTIKVNGITLKLLGETFASTYKLQTGTNTLLFEAWDKVGNYASYELVVIQDNNPPALEVISPKDNMFTGNEVLVVSGSSELNNIVTVSGVQVILDPNNGLFYYTLLLKEGTNRIVVKSIDPIGNTIEIVRNVFLDTTPPLLTVTSPGDDDVTSHPKVIVEGVVEINSELTVNGVAVPTEQGIFKKNLILGEGQNRIVVIATDKAGNKATVIKEVFLDTEAGLQIYSPEDGLRTTQENLTITGRVEAGSMLKINGLDISLDNESLFARQFYLDPGTNTFEIVVTDPNGNVVTVYRSVIREDMFVPPKKKDVGEEATDLNGAILAIAIFALIVAMLAMVLNMRKRREPPYDVHEDVGAEEMDGLEEDPLPLSDPLAPTRPNQQLPRRVEPPFMPVNGDGIKGGSDTVAEAEISVGEGETTLEGLQKRADELEDMGADTTKVRQSLRMAQIYIENNKDTKAKRHIKKATNLLNELDGSSEIEASGGEVEMKPEEKPDPSPPEDKPNTIPKVPLPPGKVKRVRKVKKGGGPQ